MSPSARIQRFFDRVAKRVAGQSRWTCAFAGLATGLALAWLIPMVAAIVPPMADLPGRRWGLAGLAAGTIIAFVWRHRRVRARWRTRRSMARYVGGQQHRQIESDLLSAVELGRLGESVAPDPRDPLVEKHLVQMADLVDAWNVDDFVSHTPPLRAARWAMAVCLVHLVSLWLFPGVLAKGWSTILSERSKWQQVNESLLSDLELHITFPGYAAKAPVTVAGSTGDVVVLHGSVVRFRAMPSRPASKAWMVFEDRRAYPFAGDGQVLTLEFPITESREYHILLEDEGGERFEETLWRTLEATPDEPPTVALTVPAEELDVEDIRRIELGYQAQDDFAVSKLEIEYAEEGEKKRRTPISITSGSSVEGAAEWDLEPLGLRPGSRVAYRLVATDNDAINGPKEGHSRTYYLRVYSQRERRETVLEDQKEWFEKVVAHLADRLTGPPGSPAQYVRFARDAEQLTRSLSTLLAHLKELDPPSQKLVLVLTEMRARLDALGAAERALVRELERTQRDRKPPSAALVRKLDKQNRNQILEYENDVLLLIDWLDRQRLENILSMSDDIKAAQERIQSLLEQMRENPSEETQAALEKELQRLEQMLADMAAKQQGVREDVLDKFVNREAMKPGDQKSCLDQVRELLALGKTDEAAKKMKECSELLQSMSNDMEKSLAELRGEKFAQQQQALESVMSDLADVAKEQQEVAQTIPAQGEDGGEDAPASEDNASKEQLEAMSRQQQAVRKRAEALGQKISELAKNLPGESAGTLDDAIKKAANEMLEAEKKLGQGKPAAASKSAQAAAQRLAKAQQQAKSQARMGRQRGERGREQRPVEIPKGEQDEEAKRFRQELLEAQRKQQAPRKFGDLVKRYYEELVK